MGSATVVGITRAPSVSEDGGVLKARCTDENQALQHAERKARTYGKALLGLASLLCLSVCGNLASSALSILVFKESRFSSAIPPPTSQWCHLPRRRPHPWAPASPPTRAPASRAGV